MGKLIIICMLIVNTMLVVGCPAEDEGTDDKKLNELTDAEIKEWCQNNVDKTNTRMETNKETICLSVGLSFVLAGQDAAACQQSSDSCVENFDMMKLDKNSFCADVEIESTCEATVNEFEACQDESDAQEFPTAIWTEGLDCSSSAEEISTAQSDMIIPEPGQACKKIYEKCPALSPPDVPTTK